MRPPEFTGGNGLITEGLTHSFLSRFNEAAGIHRRKRIPFRASVRNVTGASMRPPEFTGGNTSSMLCVC